VSGKGERKGGGKKGGEKRMTAVLNIEMAKSRRPVLSPIIRILLDSPTLSKADLSGGRKGKGEKGREKNPSSSRTLPIFWLDADYCLVIPNSTRERKEKEEKRGKREAEAREAGDDCWRISAVP